MTPAHDTNDYQLGLKHNLAFKQVFDDDGRMINVPDEFQVSCFCFFFFVYDKRKKLIVFSFYIFERICHDSRPDLE